MNVFKRDSQTSNNDNNNSNTNFLHNYNDRFSKEGEFNFEDINSFKIIDFDKVDKEIWKIKCDFEKIKKGKFMRPIRSEGVLRRPRELPSINMLQRIQNLGLKV